MLKATEKSYFLALQAIKRKDYQTAAGHFDKAARQFQNNIEFNLLRESTRLLLRVREQLGNIDGGGDRLEIQEVFSDGHDL